MQAPFLSIIIPAYNEETRLPGTLTRVADFLSRQVYAGEAWVVDNNSQDATASIIEDFSERFPSIRGTFEAQPGKGAAVRTGMLQAGGDYLFMCDADLSMPIDQVNQFLPPRLEGVDLAIASREAPGAVRYNEPLTRHLGGRMMNWLIQLLILPGLNDTQCGFKCFSSQAAKSLFPRQTLNGWSFDIELLYLARRMSLTIHEVPIPWYYRQESKLNAFQDALKILLDIQTIRQNASRGVYGPAD